MHTLLSAASPLIRDTSRSTAVRPKEQRARSNSEFCIISCFKGLNIDITTWAGREGGGGQAGHLPLAYRFCKKKDIGKKMEIFEILVPKIKMKRGIVETPATEGHDP